MWKASQCTCSRVAAGFVVIKEIRFSLLQGIGVDFTKWAVLFFSLGPVHGSVSPRNLGPRLYLSLSCDQFSSNQVTSFQT